MQNVRQGLTIILQVLFGALPVTIAVAPFLLGHLVGMLSLGVGGVAEHRELFFHGVAMLCAATGVWLTIAQQLDKAVLRRRFWHYIISAMLLLGLFEYGSFFLVMLLACCEEGWGSISVLVPLPPILVMSWQLSLQVRSLISRRRLTTA
jgi:hypothetical protein